MLEIKLEATPRIVEYLLRARSTKIVTTKSAQQGRPYYVVEGLSANQKKEYIEKMDWIFRYHQTFLKNKKARKFAGNLRPYCELVDLKVQIDREQLIDTAQQIQLMDSPYFSNLSKSLIKACGQLSSKSPHPIIDTLINQSPPTDQEPAKILSYRPLNEHQILERYIHRLSESNFDHIQSQLSQLSFKEKNTLLSRALDYADVTDINLCIEIIAEPLEAHKLINAGVASRLYKQPISPYFGYDIDESKLEDAAIEMFEKCYDYSFQLYSLVQESKNPKCAPLTVLAGYRQRMVLEIDLGGIIALSNLSPGQSKFYQAIKDLAADTFPQITELTTTP